MASIPGELPRKLSKRLRKTSRPIDSRRVTRCPTGDTSGPQSSSRFLQEALKFAALGDVLIAVRKASEIVARHCESVANRLARTATVSQVLPSAVHSMSAMAYPSDDISALLIDILYGSQHRIVSAAAFIGII